MYLEQLLRPLLIAVALFHDTQDEVPLWDI
jgi:hypothetical protein